MSSPYKIAVKAILNGHVSTNGKMIILESFLKHFKGLISKATTAINNKKPKQEIKIKKKLASPSLRKWSI